MCCVIFFTLTSDCPRGVVKFAINVFVNIVLLCFKYCTLYHVMKDNATIVLQVSGKKLSTVLMLPSRISYLQLTSLFSSDRNAKKSPQRQNSMYFFNRAHHNPYPYPGYGYDYDHGCKKPTHHFSNELTFEKPGRPVGKGK